MAWKKGETPKAKEAVAPAPSPFMTVEEYDAVQAANNEAWANPDLQPAYPPPAPPDPPEQIEE